MEFPPPQTWREGLGDGRQPMGRARRRDLRKAPSRVARYADRCSGAVLLGLIVFTPWAFGTTQAWSLHAAMVGCWLLGALRGGLRLVERWTGQDGQQDFEVGARRRWGLGLVALALGGVLLQIGVSLANARASYDHQTGAIEYVSEIIGWLPTTYDLPSTKRAFLEYLSLAVAFWAVRDWLRGPRGEDAGKTLPSNADTPEGVRDAERPAPRIGLLLWVVCLNAAALAVVCFLQRAAGSSDLLWLVKSRSGKTPDLVFGPWSYRSNAAQYFNLIWPVCLGTWIWFQDTAARLGDRERARFDGPQILLVPASLLILAASVIAGSRASAMVCGLLVVVVAWILVRASRRSAGSGLFGWAATMLAVAALAAGVIGGGRIWTRLNTADSRHLTGIQIGNRPFSLFARLNVPVEGKGRWYRTVLYFSPQITSWPDLPYTCHVAFAPDGTLVVGLQGESRQSAYFWRRPGMEAELGDQEFVLAVVRDDALRVYLNGKEVEGRVESIGTSGVRIPVNSRRLCLPSGSVSEVLFLPQGLDAAAVSERCRIPWGRSGDDLELVDNDKDRDFFHLQMDQGWRWESVRLRLSGRSEVYRNSWRIAAAFPVWGGGAGSFEALYDLYRAPHEDRMAYAHNDWLEVRVTLGWVGLGLLLMGLLGGSLAGWPCHRLGRAPPWFSAMCWVSLAGCLITAFADFPFRVFSVSFLFVILAGLLTVVTEQRKGRMTIS